MTEPSSPFRHVDDGVSTSEWGRAWAVHLFTTFGIVAALLALHNVLIGNAERAIIWLLLTLVIDGVDGPIARALEVQRRVPLIDGFLLDLIIDYVTCVIVPATFMYEFSVVPQNNFGVFVLCVMVFTSAIWFARKDMMTADNWFRGFPAAWNIIAPLLYLLQAHTWTGSLVTLVLSVLALTNMPYPHIARARWMQPYTVVFTVVWVVGIAIATFSLPDHRPVATVLMYIGTGYYVLLAILRSVHDRRTPPADAPEVAGLGQPAGSAAEGR